MVFVQGSIVKDASSADELYTHFEFGSQNRHTASTSKSTTTHYYVVCMYTSTLFYTVYTSYGVLSEMNTESSRSHLIIGIVIESTNLTTGTVIKGKVIIITMVTQCDDHMIPVVEFGRPGWLRTCCKNRSICRTTEGTILQP